MNKRLVFGILAAIGLIGILLSPAGILTLIVLAVSIVGVWEFFQALRVKGHKPDMIIATVAAIWISGYSWVSGRAGMPSSQVGDFNPDSIIRALFSEDGLLLAIFVLMITLFIRLVFGFGKFRPSDAAFTLLGIVYIPFLMSFAIRLRLFPHGGRYVWAVAVGSVMTDVFAYFVGTRLGKHKILPLVSPKKSLEGAIGGAVGCMVSMIVFGMVVPLASQTPDFVVPIHHYAILGLLCGIVSQIGDWTASAFKRETGIKDFGNLIPGHGGIMDRLDSILVTAPMVYLYVAILINR